MKDYEEGDPRLRLLQWLMHIDEEAGRRNAGRRATDSLFRVGNCVLTALLERQIDAVAANDPIYNQERRAASLFFVCFSAKSITKMTAFCSEPFVLCQKMFTRLLRVKLLIVFSFFPLFPTSSQYQINRTPTFERKR